MAMEDAAGLTAAPSGIWTLFTNHALISAFLGFAIAQALKFITFWYKEKQWDPKQLIGSGGMPSSHSATVTALAVGVGLQEGFGGSEFAIALVLACVLKQWALEKRGLPGHMVMYDATGVRLHAGRQAEVLNQILFELPAEHPLAESTPLRELLGHTPTQVAAGALLGSVTAIFINFI